MMKNREIPYTDHTDDGLMLMLAEVRLDERRGRAEVMAARLDKIARHIIRYALNGAESADLLRQEVEILHNQAREAN